MVDVDKITNMRSMFAEVQVARLRSQAAPKEAWRRATHRPSDREKLSFILNTAFRKRGENQTAMLCQLLDM